MREGLLGLWLVLSFPATSQAGAEPGAVALATAGGEAQASSEVDGKPRAADPVVGAAPSGDPSVASPVESSVEPPVEAATVVDVELERAPTGVVPRPVPVRLSFREILLHPPEEMSPADARAGVGDLVMLRLLAKQDYWRARSDADVFAGAADLPAPPTLLDAEGTARARAWTVDTPFLHFEKGRDRAASFTEESFLLLVAFSPDGVPEEAWSLNRQAAVGAFRWQGEKLQVVLLDADANGQWGTVGDLWCVVPSTREPKADDFVPRRDASAGFWLADTPLAGTRLRLGRRPGPEPPVGPAPPIPGEDAFLRAHQAWDWRARNKAELAPGCPIKAEAWVAALLCDLAARAAAEPAGEGAAVAEASAGGD